MTRRPLAVSARALLAWVTSLVLASLLAGCAGLAELQAPRGAEPVSPAQAAPAGGAQAVTLDVERIARESSWAPGQLRAHFEKHGREGPYATAEAYDAAARDTIRTGKHFRYVDRSTNARRNGFYDPAGNRFTAVTDDGRRITTHFRPDNGERYVRGLPQTTYR